MCDLETFKLDVKALKQGKTLLEYVLDDSFFEAIDAPEIRKGKVNVELQATRNGDLFELNFNMEGSVSIPCDLCLDDMEQPVNTKERLIVRFGEEYSEEDELVTLEEDPGVIDLSWFVYEFIALNIPIKHVHAPGKCNPAMIDVLEAHAANRSGDEDEEEAIDPRWMKLKEIKKQY